MPSGWKSGEREEEVYRCEENGVVGGGSLMDDKTKKSEMFFCDSQR
jgi:hypothetical protein